MAAEAKKARSPEPVTVTATGGGGTESHHAVPGAGAEENTTIDVINAARLSSLVSAARRYARDHQGLLPPMDSPEALHAALFPRYVAGQGIFQLPGSRRPYLPNRALSGKPLKSFPKPGEIIVFYAPLDSVAQEQEQRRVVVFLNGNQRRVTPPEWDVLRKKSGIP
jgi:hypothetical protein